MEDLLKDLSIGDDVKATLTTRIEEAKKNWIEGTKNDPEFIGQLRKEESGKFFVSMEKIIQRTFDIKGDEISNDITGLKRQEALLKIGLQSFEKNKDRTNQELQDELLRVKAEKKELEEDRIPAVIQEERQKHYARYVQEGIMRDTLGFDTTCSEKARAAIVTSFLQENKLHAEWDADAGEYKILTKDNLRYTKNDKPLTNKEIVELALEDADVLRKSNGSPIVNGRVVETPTRSNGKLSPNAQRMAAQLQGR